MDIQDDDEKVAPLAGAWIEIGKDIGYLHQHERSLPSRERGLKLLALPQPIFHTGRSPRGSVD